MQHKTLHRTTQHLESRNHLSIDWPTNRLIPRPGHLLLHWVFLRLRIRIEERILLCLFLCDPFLYLCLGESPCLHLCRADTGENHPHGSHHCLLTSPSCLTFLWVLFLPPFRILRLFITKECSSSPFGSSFASSFSLSFFSFHLAALEWFGLPGTLSVIPCPETSSLIVNVALLASHLIFGPLPKFVFSVVFHDECSVHAVDVSAHAE